MGCALSLARLIMHQARMREQEPALVFAGGIASFGMLARAVLSAGLRLDAALDARRVGDGAVVAIDTSNPFFHVSLMLALELRGIPTASVQSAYSVTQSGLVPAAILVDGRSAHDVAVPAIVVDASWFVTDPAAPAGFAELLALPGLGADEDAVVRVVFSSGTTGVPKSTGLTARVIERRMGQSLAVIGGASRVGTMMGFSTLGGYMQPMMTLASGGTICFGSSPVELLHLSRSLRIDLLVLAVGQLSAIVTALGAAPPPQVEMIVVTGGRIPSELLARARERLCSNILFAYGSTEAGMLAIAPAALLEGQEGNAGHLLPWVELEIVDEHDRVLPHDTAGVIRVRTPQQAHYVVPGPENQLFFRDGWFYPGDVGKLQADGRVAITGRSVEVINRGGSVVAPELIERLLTGLPGIRDAVAFGLRGPSGLDEIWAAVVSDEPLQEGWILGICRERLVDKAPDVIRRIAMVPRTETGKIRRKEVRDQFEAERSSGAA